MIDLMITDDHEMVRSAIRQFLSVQPNIRIVAEAGSGAEMLDKLHSAEVNLLMMDLQMPGICGAELIQCVKRAYPSLPILVLSAHNSTSTVVEVLKAGAAGFVSKNCLPAVLVDALHTVKTKGRYLEPGMGSHWAAIDAR
ncbi:MAG: response regulator transcription factor [Gallionella sp.]|nr:response regulator transcription factor [Gallionella sp.]